jgi:signal transduction histidine kinase
MFYIDWTYIILVMPAIIFATWASARVNTTFEKYSKQLSARRMTGEEAARRVLSANGIYNVEIKRIGGKLTDHYDPKANVIRLSDAVYSGTSTAAIGVAAHEAGHAVQHAEGMTELTLRVFTLGSSAIFEIKDNGCGIDPKRLDTLFVGGYSSGEDVADGQKRNAGIGLSVCATIVKAHGGSISAENSDTGGAVFRFLLPTDEETINE